jgi:hypothetical protein
MRKVLSVALMAAMFSMVGMTKDAGATITMTLEWGGCNLACTGLGTDSVTVSGGGGQTLRLDIFMTHDQVGGVGAHGFSLNFDTDMLNELNSGAMGAVEWAGTDVNPTTGVDTYNPISSGAILPTPESGTGGPTGTFSLIESGALGIYSLPVNGAAYTVGTVTATAPARYRVAQVFFTVNSAVTDGADLFSLDGGLADAFLDSSGLVDITGTVLFGTASVNLVPEPGTVSLLGLGLVGLVLAGRHSRRS